MENPASIWLTLFIAAVSGGLASTLIEQFVIAPIRAHWRQRKAAKYIVDAHLDPLLKAADAIVGKTISLAERDFLPLATQSGQETDTSLIGLTYLYASFWGRVEVLRAESLGISISGDSRGKKLSKFITCLESQRIRLVNRTHQKAIGEITTDLLADGGLRTIGVVEFGEKLSASNIAGSWCQPLTDLLTKTSERSARQKLLIYGIVLHSLVDTLDPEHHSTHKRSSYPNKLSRESKRRVEHLVFREYLQGTGAVNRYAQPE
ncbi:hypothetical protein H7691_15390 [Stenotrophomonas sp. CW117]|jgi:hypothetical protein|uniref:hypothetical protein n=1 Tax=Stenotrophomonas TaxID=40323 RepID=UPI000B061490|nr:MULTISPECIES: hypothetical protein [Stenotrophomonas]QOF97991.1 hypothetical protein H7691_15390 [Stenotrophomonas sp. CW117]